MKTTEKGDILENAVKEIEELIILNSALGKAKSFDVIPKMRYYEKNSRGKSILIHEVDLLITIDFGNNNKLIQIIECKNWDCKSVSKSQVNDFISKIEYTGATKGYIIGKRYSPAAEIIARSNKRVELLCFSSDKHSNIINAPSIDKVENRVNKRITGLKMNSFENIPGHERSSKELMNDDIRYNNKDLKFSTWLSLILEQDMEEIITSQKHKINDFIPGTLHFNCSREIFFQVNQLIYREKPIKSIELEYSFDLDIYLAKATRNFDVVSKGRSINYELIHPTKKGNFKMITIPNIDDNNKWDAKIECKFE